MGFNSGFEGLMQLWS